LERFDKLRNTQLRWFDREQLTAAECGKNGIHGQSATITRSLIEPISVLRSCEISSLGRHLVKQSARAYGPSFRSEPVCFVEIYSPFADEAVWVAAKAVQVGRSRKAQHFDTALLEPRLCKRF
jgi:hypothetical protein